MTDLFMMTACSLGIFDWVTDGDVCVVILFFFCIVKCHSTDTNSFEYKKENIHWETIIPVIIQSVPMYAFTRRYRFEFLELLKMSFTGSSNNYSAKSVIGKLQGILKIPAGVFWHI